MLQLTFSAFSFFLNSSPLNDCASFHHETKRFLFRSICLDLTELHGHKDPECQGDLFTDFAAARKEIAEKSPLFVFPLLHGDKSFSSSLSKQAFHRRSATHNSIFPFYSFGHELLSITGTVFSPLSLPWAPQGFIASDPCTSHIIWHFLGALPVCLSSSRCVLEVYARPQKRSPLHLRQYVFIASENFFIPGCYSISFFLLWVARAFLSLKRKVFWDREKEMHFDRP